GLRGAFQRGRLRTFRLPEAFISKAQLCVFGVFARTHVLKKTAGVQVSQTRLAELYKYNNSLRASSTGYTVRISIVWKCFGVGGGESVFNSDAHCSKIRIAHSEEAAQVIPRVLRISRAG